MTTSALFYRADTSEVEPRDRFEYWRRKVMPLRLEPLETTWRGFRASAEMLYAGDVGVIDMNRGSARASWKRETGEAQNRLRLVLLGPAVGAAARWYGADVSLAAGGAALLGATDGGWQAPAGMRGIEVDLPRAAVTISSAQLARINVTRRLQVDPVFTSLVRPALLGMLGNLRALTAAVPDDFAAVWTSLVTMLVHSLVGRDVESVDVAVARRVQAERYIHANLSNPRLSPEAIAAALHISRRSLYASAFRDDHGVAAYIRRQRLERARSLLLNPTGPESVAQIATMVGLPDPAHFSRLFRAAYGCAPRDLRQEHPQG